MLNQNKPILIAEVSANHNGSLKHAKKLILCAKKNDADIVKFQTYSPETMTIQSNKKDFLITMGLWKGQNLWHLYREAQTPFSWHKELFDYSKKIGIKCFSTPFDESAVDLLEKLKCPFYKVSSFEMTDLPLIKKIARTKKTMIISTGMANLSEIERTFKVAKKNGAKDIILLYCVSNYPSYDKDFNLNNIKILKEKFNCKVGFSDHSNNIKIAELAIAAGAEVIEKHIALENQKKGFDIKFSLKGREIKQFKKMMINTWNLLGKKNFYRNKNENKSKKFRRSIYAVENIKKGEIFTKNNIRRIRPGFGISPIYYDKILNKKSPKKIHKGQAIKSEIKNILKIK